MATPTRRALLVGAAGAVAASAAAGAWWLSPKASGGAPKVAVLGAGLAGLQAARRLVEAGVDVTVYEARKRPGGRVHSRAQGLGGSLVGEMGAEFIDSGHQTMRGLARELGLTLVDRELVALPDQFWLLGRSVPVSLLVEQLREAGRLFAQDLAASEIDAGSRRLLDETSMADYLDRAAPGSRYPELRAALEVAFRGQYGRELAEQSALNLLHSVDLDEQGDDGRWRPFGASDERWHVAEGNDQIPKGLAQGLGDRIRYGAVVEGLEAGVAGGVGVLTKGGAKESYDRVVVAAPFSVVRRWRIDLDWPEEKRRVVHELGYGRNTKVLAPWKGRIWQERGGNGSLIHDGPIQQLWDSSIGAEGHLGLLTQFTGGGAALRAEATEPTEWWRSLGAGLDAAWPGSGSGWTQKAFTSAWNQDPFSQGSYSVYLRGQWSFYGLEGRPAGGCYFAGEHTSADFGGWMEGAAESGNLAAAALLAELGLKTPASMDRFLEDRLRWPQPAFGEDPGSFVARRRARRQARS